jgi:hypothetical protein
MRRSVERLAAVVTVVILAGCGGVTGYAPGVLGETATTERVSMTHSIDQGGLLVSNARSDSYEVTIQIVDGPVKSLNVTYRNGTNRIVSVPERPSPVSPTLLGQYEAIRSVEPVNETVTLREAVGPRSNASSRFSIGWRSPTLVVTVESLSGDGGGGDGRGIEYAQLVTCEPPDPYFEELRVDLYPEAAVSEISLGMRCQ